MTIFIHSTKAVANGAVLHYLDNFVTTRACDGSYGVTVRTPYNPLLLEHQIHQDMIVRFPDGRHLWPTFSCIVQKVSSNIILLPNSRRGNFLPQNTAVDVHQVVKSSYFRKVVNKEEARHFSVKLYCYEGDDPVPFRFDKDKRRCSPLSAHYLHVY